MKNFLAFLLCWVGLVLCCRTARSFHLSFHQSSFAADCCYDYTTCGGGRRRKHNQNPIRRRRRQELEAGVGFLDFLIGGGSTTRIPTSPKERNQLMVQSVEAALKSPRTPSFKLIECEFPPLQQLNKLGDGSLQSAKQVDAANLQAAMTLVQSLSSFLPGSPYVWLILGSTATASTTRDAQAKAKNVHSFRQGELPPIKSRDICVVLAPASSQDYASAKRLVQNGNPVILVNGFAKDRKSVSGEATMAFFLKPLTYNSQVAGYLTRCYPGPWKTVEAQSGKVLGTFDDSEILVANTNTPDLRDAVRQVQKSVDEQAIRARR